MNQYFIDTKRLIKLEDDKDSFYAKVTENFV